jgi:hypothetical protein
MTWWTAPANSIRGGRDTLLCNHAKVISQRLPQRLPPNSKLLGRREQFERLAGVVDLLGAAPRSERQARDDNANPFCCVYSPMSAAGRKEFLKRHATPRRRKPSDLAF